MNWTLLSVPKKTGYVAPPVCRSAWTMTPCTEAICFFTRSRMLRFRWLMSMNSVPRIQELMLIRKTAHRATAITAIRVTETSISSRVNPCSFLTPLLMLAAVVATATRDVFPMIVVFLPMCVACVAGIVIAEGGPDFITWAVESSDADEDAPAVFGIGSGAWTPEHAARVPDGYIVTIATHDDEAGDRKRVAVAKKFLSDFGLSAECGWGRTEPGRLPGLPSSHGIVADHFVGTVKCLSNSMFNSSTFTSGSPTSPASGVNDRFRANSAMHCLVFSMSAPGGVRFAATRSS